MAPVGALGLQQLLGALGAGAFGGGERGDGVPAVPGAGRGGRRVRGRRRRGPGRFRRGRRLRPAGRGWPRSRRRRAASIASSRSRAAWPASDCAALTCPAASARAAAMWPAASRRACSAAAAAVPASWRAAVAAAWAAQTSSRAVSRASARAWASAAASPARAPAVTAAASARRRAASASATWARTRAGSRPAACSRAARMRTAACRITPSSAASGSAGIGGHGCRGGDAGVVVVAAGALVAAELPGAAAVLGRQDVAAARPLADGRRRRAGRLVPVGGIAGHDGTFRYQPRLFLFISAQRRNEKKEKGRAGDGDRGPGFLPGPAGRAGTGRVRTLRPCRPRLRRGAAGTTR